MLTCNWAGVSDTNPSEKKGWGSCNSAPILPDLTIIFQHLGLSCKTEAKSGSVSPGFQPILLLWQSIIFMAIVS